MLLVVVCDLHLVGVTSDEPEAYAPLIVGPNRVLPLPILSELMKTISGRNLEVVYSRRQIHVLKFASRSPCNVPRTPSRPSGCVELLRDDTYKAPRLGRCGTMTAYALRRQPESVF